MISLLAALLLALPGSGAASPIPPEAVLAVMDDSQDRALPVGQFPGQTTEQLELQLTEVRQHHDSVRVLPPLLMWVGGTVLFVVGAWMLIDATCAGGEFSTCSSNDAVQYGGLTLGVMGLLSGAIGLIWFIVDSSIRGDLERKSAALETELAARKAGATASSLHWRITPWAKTGASGLALSAPF